MLETPVWLEMEGRGVMERPPTIQQLRTTARDAGHLVAMATALNWQTDYVDRRRRRLLDFLVYVADDREASVLIEQNRPLICSTVGDMQKMILIPMIANLLTKYGAHLLISQPLIGSATTIRQYLLEASAPWPRVMSEGLVERFLDGLEFAAPVLPEAKGQLLQRTVDEQEVDRRMIQLAEECEPEMLLLSVGVRAGMRMRETARVALRHQVTVNDDGTVIFNEKAEAKENMRGRKVNPARTGEVPVQCVPCLRMRVTPWVMEEMQAMKLVRQTASWWKRTGLVEGIRTFRRAAATKVQDAMAADGKGEEAAKRFARAVLGHKEGSRSTVRYVPLLSQTGARELREAQLGRLAGGPREKRVRKRE